MRTVCPSCQAAYDVPAPVLASGRTLRCARCGGDFLPDAPDLLEVVPVPVSVPVAAPVPAPSPPAPLLADRLVAPVAADVDATGPRAGARLAVVAGWVASLAVLVALGWGFVAWRGAVERAWPASARAYAVLGFR